MTWPTGSIRAGGSQNSRPGAKFLPDEENSAIQVQAVFAEIPGTWLQNRPANVPQPGGVEHSAKLYDSLLDVAPEIRLGAGQVAGPLEGGRSPGPIC